MKKALAGPAKRTAKKKPERRAMIAAARRRVMVARVRAATLSKRLDRWANRAMVRVAPPALGALRRARRIATSWVRRAGRRLRPLAVLLFRGLGRLERPLRRGAARVRRIAAMAWAVVTLHRAICVAIVAAAACLAIAQFLDYRAVEIGGPGYAGLPGASAPTRGEETAGGAHAYLLLPVALLAAGLALAALANPKRHRLGRPIFALGLLSLAVALLIDLPAGLDASAEQARFAGATAVLQSGFYAEVAADVGLMVGGLILAGRHRYRLRKPRMARTQGGRRRERTV